MNTVLYFSPDDVVYETRAYTNSDIAELVHNYGLESLTSADRQFDFWFTPTTRRCRRKVNRSATELLLATTQFTAKTVPLLRGGVWSPPRLSRRPRWAQLATVRPPDPAQLHPDSTRRQGSRPPNRARRTTSAAQSRRARSAGAHPRGSPARHPALRAWPAYSKHPDNVGLVGLSDG